MVARGEYFFKGDIVLRWEGLDPLQKLNFSGIPSKNESKKLKNKKELIKGVMDSKAPREGGQVQMGDRNCPEDRGKLCKEEKYG